MKFGILGSGSWGTALAKILTDNGQTIYWSNRSEAAIEFIKTRHHNPQYLPAAHFDKSQLNLTTSAAEVIKNSDCIIIAIPSAYAAEYLQTLDKNIFENKKIISAIKGILPNCNLLLNDYLAQEFNFSIQNYFAVLGPCHAEEVAAEKLSYLTFSGINHTMASQIAGYFKTPYLNTVVNNDIYGVQYAAILKNIYAVGAGIAHGLDYGDNFLSVLIANSADEMAGFLRKLMLQNNAINQNKTENINYAASVYLGDLLVTCYSLHSRNRSFGNMIGKGYTVHAAQTEMRMVAEGYNASKCINSINDTILATMPIAQTIYKILWQNLSATEGFALIETKLV
jgi:glycerol-3-phosphate dehydrogenase (NAD(P)+)